MKSTILHSWTDSLIIYRLNTYTGTCVIPLMEEWPQGLTPTGVRVNTKLVTTDLVESWSPYMMVEPVDLAEVWEVRNLNSFCIGGNDGYMRLVQMETLQVMKSNKH